jgi:hypothetical protein
MGLLSVEIGNACQPWHSMVICELGVTNEGVSTEMQCVLMTSGVCSEAEIIRANMGQHCQFHT